MSNKKITWENCDDAATEELCGSYDGVPISDHENTNDKRGLLSITDVE